MSAVNLGALGFGLIIGWYVYYINRYRKGDVQLGDITTLIAAIGGAAVLALFPEKTDLFGFYGIGLAVGFFGYFLSLIFMVGSSKNFSVDWFLDGRRKDPDPGYSIPGDVAPTVHPMMAPLASAGTAGGAVTQQFFIGQEQSRPPALPSIGLSHLRLAASTIDQPTCQAIVYAETGTIELLNAGDAAGLQEARRFIAGVAYKRNGSGVASPKYPTDDELKQPFIKKAWDSCGTAATAASGDDVGDCRHFVIWYSDDGKTPSKTPSAIPASWPYDYTDKITKDWGPYKVNVLGGSNIYVIKYCGVP